MWTSGADPRSASHRRQTVGAAFVQDMEAGGSGGALLPGSVVASRLSRKDLLDALIGWRGAAPGTRARLLEDMCAGIRTGSLLSNSAAAVVVGAFIIAESGNPLHAGWLAAALLGGLMPRAYAARLRRNGRFDQPERKALGFLALSAVYGLIWGAGPLLILPAVEGTAAGLLLIMVLFGTIMGPYAAVPGILYVRLAAAGIPTLAAVALHTTTGLTVSSLVIGAWLVLRTDVWRGYHYALRRQIELGERLAARQAELQRAHDDRLRDNEGLRVLADTDPLTGVANRRRLMRELEALDAPAALLIFDLDDFKRINDESGHQVGDAVLVDVTRLVQGVLRKEDLLARIGGDEFALVLPGVEGDYAREIAERIRARAAVHAIPVDADIVRTTISVGVAAVAASAPRSQIPQLLHAADEALYAAKGRGRNRVEFQVPHRAASACATD